MTSEIMAIINYHINDREEITKMKWFLLQFESKHIFINLSISNKLLIWFNINFQNYSKPLWSQEIIKNAEQPEYGIFEYIRDQSLLFYMQLILLSNGYSIKYLYPWYCMWDVPEELSLNNLVQTLFTLNSI